MSKRREGAIVRLLLGEEAQHRLEPDHPHLELVGAGADPVVGADERRAGDGLELAPALVQHQLYVENGSSLAPKPDFVFRTPFALRHPSPLLGVDVQDAVCLTEPEGAEDDRLGRGRASHGSSVRVAMAGTDVAS